MDIGAQTLAQLSLENKEAKYVTLETGSKISGYTKDYLERLCRLNQVNYRMWSNGTFVIELESLLRETHTILLSYEGITFVDKNELTDPVPQIVPNILLSRIKVDATTASPTVGETMKKEETETLESGKAQAMPRFGGNVFSGGALSFVGRAVLSGSENVEEEPSVQTETPTSTNVEEAVVAKKEVATNEKPEAHVSVHVPIMNTELRPPVTAMPAVPTVPVPIPTAAPVLSIPEKPKEHLPDLPRTIVVERVKEVAAPASANDDWDALLLGEADDNKEVIGIEPVRLSKADIPSPYRPIKTSLDVSEHHDDAPLFPPIKLRAPLPVAAAAQENISTLHTPVSIPVRPDASTAPSKLDLSTNTPVGSVLPVVDEGTISSPQKGQKVVVFSPQAFPGHAESAKTPEAKNDKKEAGWEQLFSATAPKAADDTSSAVEHASLMKQANIPLKPVLAGARLPAKDLPRKPALLTSNLPMKEEEHHLRIPEAHPLMKSTGFNTAALLLVVSSFFLLGGGVLTANFGNNWNNAFYIAGVGAAGGVQKEEKATTPSPIHTANSREPNNILPFSNDMVTAPGSQPNSVIVQPIFEDGAGRSYEYAIVPIENMGTSTVQ